MAIYHFTIKTSKQCRALAHEHCAYLCREGKYGIGARAEELVCVGYGNLPSWAASPNAFWEAAEIKEDKSRTRYREIELSLPIELSAEKQKELAETFIEKHLGKHFVYTYAIHNNEGRLSRCFEQSYVVGVGQDEVVKAAAVQRNPHVHIMFCERRLDGIERSRERFFLRANSARPERGGAKKAREWTGKDRAEHLRFLRADWAKELNAALERAERLERVDHRSLKAQREAALRRGDQEKAAELNREPGQHLGGRVVSALAKGQRVSPEQAAKIKTIFLNLKLKEARAKLEKEIAARKERIAALRREYQRLQEREQTIFMQPAPEELSEKRKEINLNVAQIRALCDARLREIDGEAKAYRAQYRAALRDVLSPESVKSISESMLTKGATKRLNAERRKLQKELRGIEARGKAIAARPKSAATLAELADLRRDYKNLKSKIAENEQAREKLRAYLDRPEIQKRLESIAETVRQKNAPQRQKAQEIRARYDILRAEYKAIKKIKYAYQFEARDKRQTIEPRGGGSPVQRAIRGLIAKYKDLERAGVEKAKEKEVSLTARVREMERDDFN